MSGQMALDLFGDADRPIGLDCPCCDGLLVDHVRCVRSGTPTYVSCHRSFFGDPPQCFYAPIDNSPEAMARRRAWCQEHETGNHPSADEQ